MPVATCPSREELMDYAVGNLSDASADSLASHLDSCPSCQAELVALPETDDSLIGRLRDPLPPEPFLEEPACAQSLARARAAGDCPNYCISNNGTVPFSVSESDASTTSLPRQLGEYQLTAELGRGGMGAVYKARHTKLGRVVALKVLTRGRAHDRAAVARFEREMQAVGQLDHRHIVRAYDAREIDGTPILVMEYLEGLDLGEIVRRVGNALRGVPGENGTARSPFPTGIADACELARQAAVGLQTIYEHGLVHRDVKPSNLMLTAEGEVKILDLGLARLRGDCLDFCIGKNGTVPFGGLDEMTATGQGMGTADYMAPEQASDSRGVDIRADIYSLGCTLYKLLTGRALFSGPKYCTAFDKMTAHVHATPASVCNFAPAVPEGLAAIVDRMLAKNPADRFATPAEVVEALAPFCAGADLVALQKRAASSPPLPPGEGRGEGGSSLPSPSGRAPRGYPRGEGRQAAARPSRWKRFIGQFVVLLIVGGLAFALGILIRIHKDGQTTTVEVRERSTAPGAADTQVDVTLPAQKNVGSADAKLRLMGLVEDFFSHNFRDVTARKSLEWGEVETAKDGSQSIRYMYEATIWDKDKYVNNEMFTFDREGNFVRCEKLKGYPKKKEPKVWDTNSQQGMIALVEDFFQHNYHDITSRTTIEWGQFTKDPATGNSSIRYKYKAVIWGKDTIIQNKLFTFNTKGEFVSVKDFDGSAAGGSAAPPVKFRTAPVTRGDLTATIGASGTIEPEEVVDVAAQVEGTIVKFGDDPRGKTDPSYKGKPIDYLSPVEVGTVLAEIDSTVYKARRDEAAADLERAKAEMSAAKIRLAQANLGTTEPSGPAEAALAAARATVDHKKAGLELAQTNLDRTVIRSPVKGVVIDRRVNVGQNVGPKPGAAGLFLVAEDIEKLQIWASVNEADIGRIKKGMDVRFTIDTFPDGVFRGKVAQVRLNATMPQNVVTYTVVVAIDNPDRRLMPYMTANVSFQIETCRNVLRAPNAALRLRAAPEQILPETREAASRRSSDNRRSQLWVTAEDGQHLRPIEVERGISDGTMTEVSGPDVKEGMEVVTGMLVDGAAEANPFAPRPFKAATIGGGREAPAVVSPPSVAVTRPIVREVTDNAEFTGHLEAAQTAEMRSRVTGNLDKVLFKPGMSVKKGELLFEIDPKLYQAELDQANAGVTQAKTRLSQKATDFKRIQEVLKNKVVSQAEFDQAQNQLAEAQAAVQAAEAAVKVAQVRLEYTRITAPFAGKISRSSLDAGNLVTADKTVLATLATTDPMYVCFDVDERTMLAIRRKGSGGRDAAISLSVSCGLPDEQGFPHRGQLDSADGQIDPATGTARWRAVLPNKDGMLLPGMFVRVRLATSAPYKTLLIPQHALASEQGQNFVLVVNNRDVAERRNVKVGNLDDGLRAVTEGLTIDDWVITSGLRQVSPGKPVRPEKITTPAPTPHAGPQ